MNEQPPILTEPEFATAVADLDEINRDKVTRHDQRLRTALGNRSEREAELLKRLEFAETFIERWRSCAPLIWRGGQATGQHIFAFLNEMIEDWEPLNKPNVKEENA